MGRAPKKWNKSDSPLLLLNRKTDSQSRVDGRNPKTVLMQEAKGKSECSCHSVSDDGTIFSDNLFRPSLQLTDACMKC